MEIVNALTLQVNNRTFQNLLKEQIRSHLNGDEYLLEMLSVWSSLAALKMEPEPGLFLLGAEGRGGGFRGPQF